MMSVSKVGGVGEELEVFEDKLTITPKGVLGLLTVAMRNVLRRYGLVSLVVLVVGLPATSISGHSGDGNSPTENAPLQANVAMPRGRVHAAELDPWSGRRYVATSSGFFDSGAAGRPWREISIGGTSEEAFSAVAGGTNGEVLFVGRRDGLWRSDDAGRSWALLPSPASQSVIPLAIAAGRKDLQAIYMATARHGVYRSRNGGFTWEVVGHGLPEAIVGGRVAEIRSVVVHPTTSTRVCAASSDPVRLFCSGDGGSSWSAAERGLPLGVMEVVGSPRLAFEQAPPHRMFLAIAFRADGTFSETRLFVLAEDGHWIPIPADLPPGLGVQALHIDSGRRRVQVWWSGSLADVPLWVDVKGGK